MWVVICFLCVCVCSWRLFAQLEFFSGLLVGLMTCVWEFQICLLCVCALFLFCAVGFFRVCHWPAWSFWRFSSSGMFSLGFWFVLWLPPFFARLDFFSGTVTGLLGRAAAFRQVVEPLICLCVAV